MTDSRELVIRDGPTVRAVVDPRGTGELIPLHDATTDLLAELRETIIENGRRWQEVARAIDAVLASRLDHEGRRSATVGGFKLKVPAPTKVTYDAEVLWDGLAALVPDVISADAFDSAVEQVTTFKVKSQTVVNTLARHPDERVRMAVDQARKEEPQDRRVSVSRA